MKTQVVILSLHNSSIMDKSMSHNGKNGSMISQRNQALISAKKKRSLFHLFIPKGKNPDYCHKTQRGLNYVSTLVSSDPESKKEIYHDSSLAMSSWDSHVSINDIFGSF